MFVISCAFDERNPVIYECLANIKKFMPFEKICVAFSDDPMNFDKQKFSLIDDVLTYNNKNYCDGALWLAYEKHKSEDFFYWIHDSLVIQNDLSYFKGKQATCIRWFPEGANNPDMFNFIVENTLKNCDYKVNNDFIAIFGPILFLSRNILDKAKLFGVDKFKPTNKYEANAMERIWGIFLQYLGINLIENSLQGKHLGPYHNYDNSLVLKKCLNRM